MTNTFLRLAFLLLGCGVLLWHWTFYVRRRFAEEVFARTGDVKIYSFFIVTFMYTMIGNALLAVACPVKRTVSRPGV